MSSKILAFLILDARLLREALTRILNKRSDIMVAGAIAPSSEALPQIAASSATILLLDSVSSEYSNFRFISGVREALPDVKVVLIGMEDNEELFLRAVQAGAAGYVLKEASAMDVVAAVRAVSNGEAVCPPHLCLALFNYVGRHRMGVPDVRIRLEFGLTRRQQQLLPFIARGLTNKEIAAQLNLSEQTVKNHIHRMMQKVGADDRLSIVDLCLR